MYKRVFTAAIIFGAAALAPPVVAQVPNTCMERSQLTEALRESHHELPKGTGLQSPYRMLEIWTSPETGSFTVLVTRPDGISCVVAFGNQWQDAPPPPQSDGTAG